MIYEFDQEQAQEFIVRESGVMRKRWTVIREKLAKILQFADEVTDEVARSNAEDDAALLSEHAASQAQTSQTKQAKKPIVGEQ